MLLSALEDAQETLDSASIGSQEARDEAKRFIAALTAASGG